MSKVYIKYHRTPSLGLVLSILGITNTSGENFLMLLDSKTEREHTERKTNCLLRTTFTQKEERRMKNYFLNWKTYPGKRMLFDFYGSKLSGRSISARWFTAPVSKRY